MNHLKLGTRLGLAFGLVLLITALIAVIGIWRLGALGQDSRQLVATALERSALSQRWASNIDTNWLRGSAALKSVDSGYAESLQKDMARTSQNVAEIVTKLEASITDEKGRLLLVDITRNRAIYMDARAGLIARKKAGEDVSAAVDEKTTADLSALGAKAAPRMAAIGDEWTRF